MRVIWMCIGLVVSQILAQETEVSERGEEEADSFPRVFITKDGEVFKECKLKRILKDAVLMEHQGWHGQDLVF